MNQTIMLKLEEREAKGSRAVRKLRRAGYVPAVLYGNDVASQNIMASYLEMAKVYQQAGKHHPVELVIGDKKRLAMIKQVAVEPVKRHLQHIAFHVVKQNEKVQTEVPIQIKGEGETPAEKVGLVLIKTVDTVEVEAFPRDLPDHVEIDGTKLTTAGESLSVADITAPEGVTILSDGAQQIVSAVEPAALAAANEAAAGEATDESEVAAEHGGDTAEGDQAAEDQPGGKKQAQPAKD